MYTAEKKVEDTGGDLNSSKVDESSPSFIDTSFEVEMSGNNYDVSFSSINEVVFIIHLRVPSQLTSLNLLLDYLLTIAGIYRRFCCN